ncbi:MAG: hypothetical protein PHG64_13815 [Paludibacter sp.]|nr:hypothetical protein [Paludibacter sp.]
MDRCDENSILLKTAEAMASELNSLYKGNRLDKRDLFEFMDANDNFGMQEITHDTIHAIKERLTLWLSAYKQPGRIKINLILMYFNDMYPNTCRLYRQFITDNDIENKPSTWKLLDFILSEIDRDITEYSETELEQLIKRVDVGATRACAGIFSEFLKTEHEKKPLSQWVYEFGCRDRTGIKNEAYSLESFSIMAYCIFNENMWSKQNLIEKAVQSKQCADVWLFVALHFICALRASDMIRLPAPTLPYDGATVLSKISSNTFDKNEAAMLVDELNIRLKSKPMKPSKTSAHENVPDLKLFVPESLRVPLGIIMAIALAHKPELHPGDTFVYSGNVRYIVANLFCEHFLKALGNKNFSSRRCNKSYLQGIDAVVADSPGKPKGYMLAALARSHKGGIGSLPETTDIYLKDANFNGYKPEFIVQQMFERGVFSFIPAVLLEIYVGNDYKTLSVRCQTKLICELGLAAHQVEWMVAAVERTLIKSKNTVNSILQNPLNIKPNVGDILKNIASGNAPGRQGDCLCLMTAAGFPCPYSDRASCIGCGYEIYTKTAMHTLMSEYARLMSLKKSVRKSDSWRYEKILEQAVLPAISEMLAAVKLLYQEADTVEIFDIVERGLNHVDSVI